MISVKAEDKGQDKGGEFLHVISLSGDYGTFVPTYFRSWERKSHMWNFRSLELSLPRTFVI